MQDRDDAHLADTVYAWDRSKIGHERESSIWSLDVDLALSEAVGVIKVQLEAIRMSNYERTSTNDPSLPASTWKLGISSLGDGSIGGMLGGGGFDS